MSKRSAAEVALKHIWKLMNAPDGGPIDHCFETEGINGIVDFYKQSYKHIIKWQYNVPHPTDNMLPDVIVPMNRGHIRQMQCMHYWLRKLAFDNGEAHLSNDAVMLLTSDEYEAFRL